MGGAQGARRTRGGSGRRDDQSASTPGRAAALPPLFARGSPIQVLPDARLQRYFWLPRRLTRPQNLPERRQTRLAFFSAGVKGFVKLPYVVVYLNTVLYS